MQKYRVVDHLVRACADLGVTHIFGVDGANIEDLYDAIFDANGLVTGVVAKHEFSAATMADGYSRATRDRAGLGVVAATSGGGAMNLLSGLAESFTSRIPVLALVGQPPTHLEGHGAFQDSSGQAGSIDAVRLFGEISRYCARVERAQDLPAQLAEAVAAALGSPGGPAVLLLPKDVQQQTLDPATEFGWLDHVYRPDLAGIAAVQEALTAARSVGKTVVILGDQVSRDGAQQQVRELVRALDAAVGVTPDAKDAYGVGEPGYCGVAGIMGHPDLVAAIEESALCLFVGTRLPVTAAMPPVAEATLASIGAEPPYLSSTHAASADLSRTLADLVAALGGAGVESPHHPSLPDYLAPPPATGPGLRYREAVELISQWLPSGSDVFADAGNTGASVVHYLDTTDGGRFTVALGMGGMGYSFGAATGSSFARPDRRTVVIAGDGAFFMHGMEIHTAIEHQLPMTFVVFNNNAHAMCVTREQLLYRDRYSFNRFRPAQLGVGMAAMFPDLPSFAAHTADELAAALHRDTDGPLFIEVQCDPDEIPPFVPFLK